MFIQKLSTILSGNRQFFALHAKLNNFEELREKFLNCFGVWNKNSRRIFTCSLLEVQSV